MWPHIPLPFLSALKKIWGCFTMKKEPIEDPLSSGTSNLSSSGANGKAKEGLAGEQTLATVST